MSGDVIDDLRCQYGDGYDGDEARAIVVGEVQGLLEYFGAKIDEDDLFGPLTKAAVEGFQKANGLSVTGVVDAATSAALQDDSSNPIGASTVPVKVTSSGPSKGLILAVNGAGAVTGIVVAVVGHRRKSKAAVVTGVVIGLVSLIGGGIAASR
jgi:peptidoglycan hydrolase-like protein with peptidoglycan-binding domain